MTSYFDEINQNRIKSVLLMLVFGAIFAGIVYIIALFVGGIIGFAIGIVIILAYALFTYFYGSKLVLKMSKAQLADKKEYPQLYNIIESLSLAAQLKMPEVYIVNDPSPNAFATGKNKDHAAVAVTTGLLSMMNKNELEGVLAHEMSHIADNDIQFMLFAVVFAGAIGLVAAIIRNIFLFGAISGGGRRNEGIFILIGLAVGILAPLFALLLKLAISRKREYMADANGARVIRAPGYLADALKKIQAYEQKPAAAAPPVKHANEITSSLYFSNPFKSKSLMNLFSTHPPIEDRIAKLEQMY
jgi:heat shock protein HtpX